MNSNGTLNLNDVALPYFNSSLWAFKYLKEDTVTVGQNLTWIDRIILAICELFGVNIVVENEALNEFISEEIKELNSVVSENMVTPSKMSSYFTNKIRDELKLLNAFL